MNVNDKQTMLLTGLKALVTGGAQGIGAGIVSELAREGASVTIVDQQKEKSFELALEINKNGGDAYSVTADLSTKEGCLKAINESILYYGGMDILVNCAAPARNRDMIGELDSADWDIHQKLVLNSTVILSEAASNYLKLNGNGSIVNISSIIGYSIAVDQCSWPYHVTKAGLDHLTRWLAVRLGNLNIRVNAIAPGLVDRENARKLTDDKQNQEVINQIVPLKRAGTASDIAQAVVFLCSKKASYITGQVLTVDGGLGLSEVFGASLRTYKKGINNRK